MKFLTLTLITASVLVATNSQALTYKFVAKDNSAETKLCVLAGSNEQKQLKRKINRYAAHGNYFTGASYRATVRFVANNIKCNNMVIGSFARRYNADDVASYLDKFTLPKNKDVETKVTIKDIASLSMN